MKIMLRIESRVQISALAAPAEAHLRIATALTEVNSVTNHVQVCYRSFVSFVVYISIVSISHSCVSNSITIYNYFLSMTPGSPLPYTRLK